MTESDYKHWLEKNTGWIIIWVACLIPVISWMLLNPIPDNFNSPAVFFFSLGKLTGIVGFVLYAINMVLAIRQRWLENLFGGLNRVYIAHHLTGGIALAFLLFHPLFLAVRYIDIKALETIKDSALFLLPHWLGLDGYFNDVIQNVAFNSGIIAFIGMVGLLIVTFYVKLPYRIWLFTHKFLGVAFLFAGIHTLFISSDVSRNSFLRYYMLAWILLGIFAFIYRTLLGNVFVRRTPFKVERIVVVAGNTVAVELSPLDKQIDFKPGQFVFIRFLWGKNNGIISEAHPFSIASAPTENGLRLYMKALGDFTTSLKHLQVGTIAEVEGAFGRFSYTNFGDTPQVWIAGGIGITPFLSMARSYNAESPAVSLFYSVLKREELLDQEALANFLPSNYSQFKYFPYVADEQTGFLTAQYIVEKAGDLHDKEIFICGPPPMMKSMRSQLNGMGIPNRKIHTEEFAMS